MYDQETGLYYLQSRYYDPETGRFINADDPDYLGLSGTPLSYNAFAYCENNLVNDSDPTGLLSLNSLKKSLNEAANILNKYIRIILKIIKKKIQDFLSIIKYKNGILSVSATASALVFDSVISLCCKTAGVAMKSFEFGLKIAEKFAKNKLQKFFKEQMVPVLSYGVLNKVFSNIRFAIWGLVSKSTSSTAKYIDAYVLDNVLSGFLPLQIVAMFSSWGSFMSGILDASDGKFNGTISIKVK
ncbi:MAG: RHS repeat-associated core domain-containing protein [Acutalibacteraceae bacterium]